MPPDADVRRVGVVGLGAMGTPITRHLLGAGFRVTCCDVDPGAVGAAVALGASGASTPADVGRTCDCVLVAVPADDDVLAVCAGTGGLAETAHAGLTVLICSSVRPETCRAVARALEPPAGVLDAGLTGGVRGAEEGRINLLAGGDPAALDRVRPVLTAFCSGIHHLGPLGSGQVGKTVNNLVHWGTIATLMEAFQLGERLGVPASRLRRALIEGPADSRTLRELEQMRLTWWAKDLANAAAVAEAVGEDLPLARLVRELMPDITVARIARLLQVGGAETNAPGTGRLVHLD
jgi:3-hydroxyisobutyrate dehydrogenase-like beta-hydroxyacid dehydrogenase